MALKCGGEDHHDHHRRTTTAATDTLNGPHDVSSSAFFRRFLLDRDSPLHRYYRWKVFSLCQGDEQFRWMLNQNDLTFRMEDGGPLWESPQMDPLALRLFDREQSEIRARKEKQRALPAGSFLTSREKGEFLAHLGTLTLERHRINAAMCFALARAYAAPDLVATIVSHAFYEDARTPAPTMISHLYLVSDLLHNSGERAAARVNTAGAHRITTAQSLYRHGEGVPRHFWEAVSQRHGDARRKGVARVGQVGPVDDAVCGAAAVSVSGPWWAEKEGGTGEKAGE